MATISGTAYFVNFTKACDYYKAQGLFDDREYTPVEINAEIGRKIVEGEIYLGQPEIKEGEKLSVVDGRYHIES
jgi:hypothetical protein